MDFQAQRSPPANVTAADRHELLAKGLRLSRTSWNSSEKSKSIIFRARERIGGSRRLIREHAKLWTAHLRRIIYQKIRDGNLPYDSARSISGGPAGDYACDACGHLQAKMEFVTLVPSTGDNKIVRLHLRCFTLWNEVRRMAPQAT